MAKNKKVDELSKFGYICTDCAKALGGKWPEGHVATFHKDTCPVCHKEEGLASVGDWDWPDGIRRGMRD